MRRCWLPLALLAAAGAAGCARKAETRDAAPDAEATSTTAAPAPGDAGEIVVDPFCGVRLRRSEAAASAEYGGKTWWFCLADHRDAFLADPEGALRRLRASNPDAAP
ncbi:MAG: YHS domain-containing protein [Myxococcales bacterium]|nr:YHS domain-containing protein [Myxococcales bacterium]